ncbi:xylose isomerase [Vibrio cholerae]|nr:xylose isomerase [Vibrio cholerae]
METKTVRQTTPHNLDRPPTAYRDWNEEIGVKILNGELSLNEAADYQFDVGVYLDS